MIGYMLGKTGNLHCIPGSLFTPFPELLIEKIILLPTQAIDHVVKLLPIQNNFLPVPILGPDPLTNRNNEVPSPGLVFKLEPGFVLVVHEGKME